MPIIRGLLCLLCVGYGLLLLFAKDAAWRYVAWRDRNRGIAAQRTGQWDSSSTVQGVLLIVAGLLLLLLVPHPSPRAQAPAAGAATVTIDGRPATPEERRIIESRGKGTPR